MDNKKEIKLRKFCIVLKNGSKFILSANHVELDDKYSRDDRLRLFKVKEGAFSEIATFNFENIAGWYEILTAQNSEDEDDG